MIVDFTADSAGFFERSGLSITRTIPDSHAPGIDIYDMKLAAGKLQKFPDLAAAGMNHR